MKLYTLYLSDGAKQEVLALRIKQALAAAKGRVVNYTVSNGWK